VHLDDLCASDPVLKSRMDHVLQEKVYPLVRSAFAEAKGDGDEPPLGSLCVYDSIFVRYNGDKAKAAGRRGASQPLHQDGGIYSVNIALNNAHDDGNEHGFSGGQFTPVSCCDFHLCSYSYSRLNFSSSRA
jgi:hypothetical protein